jgi:hypothetical protein
MPFGVQSYDWGNPHRQKADNTGMPTSQIFGAAPPKAATSSPVWRIFKVTYDVNGAMTSIDFLNGSVDYDQIWDYRNTDVNGNTATYT